MPISVKWYDDKHTIIIAAATDPWTWEDYFAAQEQVSAMIDEVDYVVDTIADFTHTRTLPPRAISALPKIAELTHKRQTMTSVGHTNKMGELASRMFTRLYRRVNAVRTMEHALEMVAEMQAERADAE